MKKLILPESEIIEMYKTDVSINDISDKYKCSVNPIRKILKSKKVLLPYFLSKYEYTHAIKLLNKHNFQMIYNKHKTMKSVAKYFNIGLDLARSIVKYHGIEKINTSDRKRINTGITLDKEKIIENYVNDNKTITEISKQYICTPNTIRKILKSEDIKIRTTSECILSKNAKRAYAEYTYCQHIKKTSISSSEFAHRLSCSNDTAIKILKHHNIPTFELSSTKLKIYDENFETVFYDYTIIDSSATPNMRILHNPCGTEFIVQKQTILRYNNHKNRLCPKCSPRLKTSIGEDEIYEHVKNVIPDMTIIRNTKGVIPPLELDIYIPELNIAIEYCGLYWHSEIYKNNKYHHNKMKLCSENGIRLITIFEDEWLHKSEIVKQKIKHILGKSKKRIFARKCTLVDLRYQDCFEFITKNHLQGMDKAKYYIGLTYDDEIIAVMSLKKLNPSRGKSKNRENKIEISRYCTSIHVVGGFDKILKYFIKEYAKNLQISQILSYCDLRWGNGNVYKKTGFDEIKDTIPNYWYIDRNKRIHRYNYTKQNLMKQYPEMLEMTEKEIMKSLGFNRIYDCGSRLYMMKINNNVR